MMTAEIAHPQLPIKLIFEDDGRTGYAYLVRQGEAIVADVWIYNTTETPKRPDWTDPALQPFRNSKDYVKPNRSFGLPNSASDIMIDWSSLDGRIGGLIFIYGMPVAALYEGEKPGRSLMAKRDGPLARVLEFQPSGIFIFRIPGIPQTLYVFMPPKLERIGVAHGKGNHPIKYSVPGIPRNSNCVHSGNVMAPQFPPAQLRRNIQFTLTDCQGLVAAAPTPCLLLGTTGPFSLLPG